jgi:predicted RNA-binding protein with RPS1 domain
MGLVSTKNRRKLQPQQEQPKEDKDSVIAKRLPSQAKKFHPRSDKQNMARGQPKQRSQATAKSAAQQDFKSSGNTEKKKTKKFQKPKHLKRKLESAVDDGDLQQKVLQELQSFEALKSSNPKKKKQKLDTKSSNEHEETVRHPQTSTALHTHNRNDTKSKDANNSTGSTKAVQELQSCDAFKSDRSKPKTKKQKLDTKITRHVDDPLQQSSNLKEEKASTTLRKENRNDAKPKDANNNGRPIAADETIQEVTNKGSLHCHNISRKSSFSAASSSKKSHSNDDDDDDEVEGDHTAQRTRGRRRRGRKKTSEQVEQQEQQHTAIPSLEPSSEHETKTIKDEETAPMQDKNERYCVGRKPVTDFVVGQSYAAKVVYMKPFGVFFDIGCHSDAFCHISRLSDDYVENPEQLFQLSDQVPAVRIIEVDRKTKRITVSLQSQARIDDEKASLEARLRRKVESLSAKRSKTPATSSTNNLSPKVLDGTEPSNDKKVVIVANKSATTVAPAINKPESEMTPDELKRARKIARRAIRRQQPQVTQEGVD